MATGDAFSQFVNLLREYVDPAVVDLTLPEDDLSWSLIDMMKADTIAGRHSSNTGYEASMRMRIQRAGLVAGGNWSGNTWDNMGVASNLPMRQAANAVYPDPLNVPDRAHIVARTYLRRIMFNLTCNDQQIIADMAARPLEEVAYDKVEDVVHLFRKYLSSCFWGGQSGGTGIAPGVLARVNGGQVIYEAAGSVTTLTIDEGTCFRFEKGQRYQLAVDDGDGTLSAPAAASAGVFRCVTSPDPYTRMVQFQAEPGVGDITATDNYVIILADTYDFTNDAALAPEGWGTLIRDSGTYPGTSLTVTGTTELKAYIIDHSSAPVAPTPDLVEGVLDDMSDIGKDINLLVCNRRIATYYNQLLRAASASTEVPMMATFRGNGGVGVPMLGHGDRSYAFGISRLCLPNAIHGIKPEVWHKFMPLGDRLIHWKYASGVLSGASNIFHPVHAGRQSTEMAEAPGWAAAQIACEDPRHNCLIKGVKDRA